MMERRTVLKGGVIIAACSPALALALEPTPPTVAENPFAKVRRLGKELSQALAEAGEIEYAYIRPAGVEFPGLLANRKQIQT